jgi:hypothetical protein
LEQHESGVVSFFGVQAAIPKLAIIVVAIFLSQFENRRGKAERGWRQKTDSIGTHAHRQVASHPHETDFCEKIMTPKKNEEIKSLVKLKRVRHLHTYYLIIFSDPVG